MGLTLIPSSELISVSDVLTVSAATVYTENKTGSEDGYDFELWKDRGNTKMTLLGNGAFSCEWNNINNCLFRTGKKLRASSRLKKREAFCGCFVKDQSLFASFLDATQTVARLTARTPPATTIQSWLPVEGEVGESFIPPSLPAPPVVVVITPASGLIAANAGTVIVIISIRARTRVKSFFIKVILLQRLRKTILRYKPRRV